LEPPPLNPACHQYQITCARRHYAPAWAGFLREWSSRLIHGTLADQLAANKPSAGGAHLNPGAPLYNTNKPLRFE